MKSQLCSRFAKCAAILTASLASAAVAQADVYVDAGRGPVAVHIPTLYSNGHPAPLVLILHGYGSSADRLEQYVNFTPLADEQGFLLAFPNGLQDALGARYWNATDACCDFTGDTDDSGYLRALIDAIAAIYNVDVRRIFFFGHSNGGFMAHRMACDHADVVAATASMAGATWLDSAYCNPARPINILEIHGSADATILYGGGCLLPQGCYPAASSTMDQWAQFNHCLPAEVLPEQLDLTTDIAGPDTAVYSYDSCDLGGSATLFTTVSGSHRPALSPSFNHVVIQYLLSHPQPSAIPCADVEALEASCNGEGTLVAQLRLADSEHRKTTVDLAIDGVVQAADIVLRRARATLQHQAPGSHRVSLVEPAGCVQPVELTCGQ